MKRIVIFAVVVLAAKNLHAQGEVAFINIGAPITHLVTMMPVSGTAFQASLYYLPDTGAMPTTADFDAAGIILLPDTTSFLPTGVFAAGTRITPNTTTPGGIAWFQVRAWEVAFGTSYEQAIKMCIGRNIKHCQSPDRDPERRRSSGKPRCFTPSWLWRFKRLLPRPVSGTFQCRSWFAGSGRLGAIQEKQIILIIPDTNEHESQQWFHEMRFCSHPRRHVGDAICRGRSEPFVSIRVHSWLKNLGGLTRGFGGSMRC